MEEKIIYNNFLIPSYRFSSVVKERIGTKKIIINSFSHEAKRSVPRWSLLIFFREFTGKGLVVVVVVVVER